MTAADALLRAILDDPADDLPRLVYADEIEGTDPEYAEYIRLRVEIEKRYSDAMPRACPDCEYEPYDGYHHNRPDCILARSEELFGRHADKWFGEVTIGAAAAAPPHAGR